MDEYYFLFALAFIWTVFASIQDIRKREVANWLNFSLLSFALAYRAFYALIHNNAQFFLFGLYGVVIFYFIANLLYYSRSFGGGDAKLLIPFGAIIPASSFYGLIFNLLAFIFILFFVGALYTLIASVFLVKSQFSKFKAKFGESIFSYRYLLYCPIILIILSFLLFAIVGLNIGFPISIIVYFCLFTLIFTLIYIYLMSVEKACLIKFIPPKMLTEGDWLINDVKIGRKIIKSTVHGLDRKDIEALRKAGKKVWIKYGLPFAPVFLATLIITVFFYSALGIDFRLFFSLF